MLGVLGGSVERQGRMGLIRPLFGAGKLERGMGGGVEWGMGSGKRMSNPADR